MCHGQAIAAFPEPVEPTPFAAQVAGYRFGDEANRNIALLPDIYGCNPFYRGLATLLMQQGAQVWLVDTFAEFGHLPEMTREAAYARRNKVRDAAFVDKFEVFAKEKSIDAVIGFCLGGLYVFELARRDLEADLIGLYGFPQGMPNQDPLPVPFDYLPETTRQFTMLMGSEDEVVGPANIARLEELRAEAKAMRLELYEGFGHNFLPHLDSDDTVARRKAQHALDIVLASARS